MNVPASAVINTPINKSLSVPYEYTYWTTSITRESEIKPRKKEKNNQKYLFIFVIPRTIFLINYLGLKEGLLLLDAVLHPF